MKDIREQSASIFKKMLEIFVEASQKIEAENKGLQNWVPFIPKLREVTDLIRFEMENFEQGYNEQIYPVCIQTLQQHGPVHVTEELLGRLWEVVNAFLFAFDAKTEPPMIEINLLFPDFAGFTIGMEYLVKEVGVENFYPDEPDQVIQFQLDQILDGQLAINEEILADRHAEQFTPEFLESVKKNQTDIITLITGLRRASSIEVVNNQQAVEKGLIADTNPTGPDKLN